MASCYHPWRLFPGNLHLGPHFIVRNSPRTTRSRQLSQSLSVETVQECRRRPLPGPSRRRLILAPASPR